MAEYNNKNEIEEKLKNNLVDYKGTKEFFSSKINEVFYNKILKIESGSEREDGQETFIQEIKD